MNQADRRKGWKPPRYQSFALFKGKLFFPTVGVTPMGMLTEMEPVRVLPVSVDALGSALELAFKTVPPVARDYSPGDSPPKSPLQLAAGCRSWRAFARGSVRFGVVETELAWQIAVSAGPRADESVAAELPRHASAAEIAETTMAIAARYGEWKAETDSQ